MNSRVMRVVGGSFGDPIDEYLSDYIETQPAGELQISKESMGNYIINGHAVSVQLVTPKREAIVLFEGHKAALEDFVAMVKAFEAENRVGEATGKGEGTTKGQAEEQELLKGEGEETDKEEAPKRKKSTSKATKDATASSSGSKPKAKAAGGKSPKAKAASKGDDSAPKRSASAKPSAKSPTTKAKAKPKAKAL